jgi:hypothetical protein
LLLTLHTQIKVGAHAPSPQLPHIYPTWLHSTLLELVMEFSA